MIVRFHMTIPFFAACIRISFFLVFASLRLIWKAEPFSYDGVFLLSLSLSHAQSRSLSILVSVSILYVVASFPNALMSTVSDDHATVIVSPLIICVDWMRSPLPAEIFSTRAGVISTLDDSVFPALTVSIGLPVSSAVVVMIP